MFYHPATMQQLLLTIRLIAIFFGFRFTETKKRTRNVLGPSSDTRPELATV